MWFIAVEVEQETSAQNPGSAPESRLNNNEMSTFIKNNKESIQTIC